MFDTAGFKCFHKIMASQIVRVIFFEHEITTQKKEQPLRLTSLQNACDTNIGIAVIPGFTRILNKARFYAKLFSFTWSLELIPLINPEMDSGNTFSTQVVHPISKAPI